MLILFFDTETTGLDFINDRVIEVGAILYSTEHRRTFESTGYLVQSDVPISPLITQLTHIEQSAVDAFGYSSSDGLDKLLDLVDQADVIAGQNVVRFDKRMLESWCKRQGKEMPKKLWLDSRFDLPLGVETATLKYMACNHGFLPSTSHAALADCETVLRIMEHYDFNVIKERAESPTLILKALVSYDTNALAKEKKFGWNPKHKLWWKVVKQIDLDNELKDYKFKTEIVKDIPVEELIYG